MYHLPKSGGLFRKKNRASSTNADTYPNLNIAPSSEFVNNNINFQNEQSLYGVHKLYHLPKMSGRFSAAHFYSVTKSFAPTWYSCKSIFYWLKTQEENWFISINFFSFLGFNTNPKNDWVKASNAVCLDQTYWHSSMYLLSFI